MKTFSLVALILLLCSCSAPHHDSTQAVKQFYTSWMTTFTNDVNIPDDTTALMQRYVGHHRLNATLRNVTLLKRLFIAWR
ncbi:Putative lipoprotein [Salmonella enterica subsp. enterica serovar Inverness str. R8-3668]|uniref:Putative lipoprotein n=1 Tax=Salmonella enterica subsp. enterica serovar Inverness str. R8-3668 TaxID=913075 RepID=G5NFX7_SALET|nr:Putative lipoprotein [Salmonella enterica subsp. enterica serovar Inverness str. R8-3668]